MPTFLEDKLKAAAAAKGKRGRAADAYVYGTLNNLGAMHGNKETAKGRAMDATHAKDTRSLALKVRDRMNTRRKAR